MEKQAFGKLYELVSSANDLRLFGFRSLCGLRIQSVSKNKRVLLFILIIFILDWVPTENSDMDEILTRIVCRHFIKLTLVFLLIMVNYQSFCPPFSTCE